MPATHRVAATPETTRFGAFDASFPPVATIASGDLVTLECVSGAPEIMPEPETGMRVPPALAAIHAANPPRLGPHIITGPVAVAGAEPGDALRVEIERIELGADWGFCGFRPLFGTLPEDFPMRACCTSRWTGGDDLPSAGRARRDAAALARSSA
jgi:acetamidase/formamidase